jgi:hypothetical protein
MIMNQNNKMLLFKNLCFYKLMFLIFFAEMELEP